MFIKSNEKKIRSKKNLDKIFKWQELYYFLSYSKLSPIIFHHSLVIYTIRSRNEEDRRTDFWFVRDGA